LICFPKGQRSFSKTNGKTIRQEKVKMNWQTGEWMNSPLQYKV
jgi:hypothetical protein